MIRTILAVAILLMASATAASAGDEERDYEWVQQRVRVRNYGPCDDWWNRCERWRYVTRWVRRATYRLPEINIYANRGERGPECRDFVAATGEERYGRDRAKESAEQAWMEAVRNLHGVRYMDLRNSRGGTWECGRSSTGNRASERAQEFVGKFLEQCHLRGRPCRAELERVEKDR